MCLCGVAHKLEWLSALERERIDSAERCKTAHGRRLSASTKPYTLSAAAACATAREVSGEIIALTRISTVSTVIGQSFIGIIGIAYKSRIFAIGQDPVVVLLSCKCLVSVLITLAHVIVYEIAAKA